MPLDFTGTPSPTLNQNGFRWDQGYGLWMKEESYWPPNDAAEYIRVFGVWRKKHQTLACGGAALTSGVYADVPPGAKRVAWDGCVTPNSGGSALTMMMWFSNTTGAANYKHSGWGHNGGTVAYSNVPTAGSSSYARFDLGLGTNNFTVAGSLHGWVFEGSFNLTRPNSTKRFSGWSNMWTYNGSGNWLFGHAAGRLDLEPAGVTGDALSLTRIYFGLNDSWNMATHSFISLEWFY